MSASIDPDKNAETEGSQPPEDSDGEPQFPTLPASGDVSDHEMLMSLRDEMVNQRKELTAVKREQRQTNKKLAKAQDEITKLKNFRSMFEDMGGDTWFYMDLKECYEKMKLECGDDPQKLEELEQWYKSKRAQGIAKIAVSFVVGAGVGALVGGLTFHSPTIAAACACLLPAAPAVIPVLIGIGVGAVLVGVGIGIYAGVHYHKKRAQKNQITIENPLAVASDQNQNGHTNTENMNLV